jgi:hypothetical protein
VAGTLDSCGLGATLTDLTSDSDAYLVDTLAWLLDRSNGNTMVSTLHYYLNQDIKPTDEFSYAEVWNHVAHLEADGLVAVL